MHPKLEKILAIILLLAIIISAYLAVTPKPKERYTEFFVLNDKSKAVEYPKKLTLGQNATVIAGIVNHEQEEKNYILRVDLSHEKILENKIELKDGEKLVQDIKFKPSRTGIQKLELKLFKDNSSPPYSLDLYLEVNP